MSAFVGASKRPNEGSWNPACLEEYHPSYQDFPSVPDKAWNVLFVGGILNGPEDVALNVEKLRELSGRDVVPFWNNAHPSHWKDAIKTKSVALQLAKVVGAYLQRGRLCIIAHSHGAKVTSFALASLRNEGILQAFDARLEVYTYGGVTAVPEDCAHQVGNYTNPDDGTQKLGMFVFRNKADKTLWTAPDLLGKGHQFIDGYLLDAKKKIEDFVMYSENA